MQFRVFLAFFTLNSSKMTEMPLAPLSSFTYTHREINQIIYFPNIRGNL